MRLWRSIKNHLVPHQGNAHRPHILRRGWLIAFLALALISEAGIIGNTLLTGGPNIFLAAVVRSDVIELTDEARTAQGGQTLRESDVLDAAAQAKADDMAAKGYFSHVDPAGEEPWAWFARGGYSYVYAGENLAVRFNDSRDVVDAWMASPTHRANIVKPQYQEVGVGIADGTYKGGPATFVVQFFASPAVAQAAVQPVAAAPEVSSAPQTQGSVAGAQVEPAQAPVAEPVLASVQEAARANVGAQPVPAPKPSFMQSVMRSLAKAFGDSRTAGTWALATIAALLLTVLALTFFIRIQVQPTDLLLPGLAVALIAVTLLGANAKFLPTDSQSASVIESQTGDIGDAAATQRVQVAYPAPGV